MLTLGPIPPVRGFPLKTSALRGGEGGVHTVQCGHAAKGEGIFRCGLPHLLVQKSLDIFRNL